MAKSVIDGFGRTDSDIEPFDPSPDISGNVQQTLDRLMIWDVANHIWRKAASDIDGRLVISMSGVAINIAQTYAVSAGVAASIIIPGKSTRRKFAIFNNGAFKIFVGFQPGLTAINGFPFPSGATWVEDAYIGDIWAISPSGANDLRVMDF